MVERVWRFSGAALLALVVLVFAALAPAAAQEDGQERMNQLIQDLRVLIERGENQREADPWFLQDLREILARYENVWPATLYQRNLTGVSNNNNIPGPWQIASGRFEMDYELGLRSTVRPQVEAAQPQNNDEAVGQILAQILGQALGAQQQQPSSNLAAAVLPVTVTNAFAMTGVTVLRSDQNRPGRIVFGVYQGEPNGGGYRLVLYPDAAPGEHTVELIRKSSRGTLSLVEFHDAPLAIADRAGHKIEWSRDLYGNMVVKIDDLEVLSTSDRSFRDPFDGFSLLNGAGDFSLAYLEIKGTN